MEKRERGREREREREHFCSPGATIIPANKSLHFVRDNLLSVRKVTDSISSMLCLSGPMPQPVISLHLRQWASTVTAIITATNYPPDN